MRINNEENKNKIPRFPNLKEDSRTVSVLANRNNSLERDHSHSVERDYSSSIKSHMNNDIVDDYDGSYFDDEDEFVSVSRGSNLNKNISNLNNASNDSNKISIDNKDGHFAKTDSSNQNSSVQGFTL